MTGRLKLLSVCLIFTFSTGSVFAGPALKRLYKDPVHSPQLSGAARILLKHKFSRAAVVTAPAAELTPRTTIGNIVVNNPAADVSSKDTQSTTALVLGSGSNIVSAFNDTGSFTGSNNHYTGFSQSTDSGGSFADKGALPNSPQGDAGDPVLAVNQTSGTILLATLGFTTGENIQVFRSTNDGATFGAPINATPGYVGSADFQDKPWIAFDNFPGTGQGNAYLAWRRFPFTGNGDIRITRSTDDGLTWGPSLGTAVQTLASPTDNAQGAFVVVGVDHSVNVFWFDVTGATRTIKMKKSTDSGATFGTAVTVTSIVTSGVNGNLGLNGDFLTNCFPQAIVNPANGDLYVAYNDDPAGLDKANVFLRRSTDGGVTWAAAITVNSDSSGRDQFHPSLAVLPDGSRVFVGWYDRRDDASNQLIHRYGKIYTVDGTGALIPDTEFRISTQSFPPAVNQDPAAATGYMGDYDQSAADSNFFYTVWGDNRDGDAAHTHEPNVRFAKIAITGPGAVLELNGSTIDDSGGNNTGSIDPNECIQMNVALKNSGTATATGISATLSTATPGIILNQTSATYNDISAGGTASANAPFQFVTNAGFNCGNKIDFLLTVSTAADGTFQVPVSIVTGADGSIIQSDQNGTTVIPDLGMVEVPISVSGIDTAVKKVKVSFHIRHTSDSDLDIFLVGPDSTIVELSTDNGGVGANYGAACTPQSARTTLDDAAVTSITTANPPFSGTFQPEGKLSDFAGKSGIDANGVWKLLVIDDSGGDTGVLDCWSLIVTPASCTPGTGPCGCSAISITPPTLPDGSVGTLYTQTLTATGGAGPYTFSLASGALPTGLSISPAGNLTGTPSAAGVFNFTISAQDSGGCVGVQSYTITTTCPAIALSPATLPNATLGTSYNQNLSSSGGTLPYSYAITSGSLPPGITLSSSGFVSGTPVAPAGLFNFTVTSTDAFGCTGQHSYSIDTSCTAITLQPATLPGGDTTTPYAAVLTGNGGVGPYTFAVTTGSLPGGLNLDAAGNLTGTPTAGGSFPFTVTATDSNSCTGTQDYTIVITPCLFCDDFEDGQLALNWTYIKPAWSEAGGSLIGAPSGKKAIAVAAPAFLGCSNCTMEARLSTAGGAGNRVWVLGWYVDKKNTLELLMKEENNLWILKQRVGGSVTAKAKAAANILPNTSYHIVLQQNPGLGTFTLQVDGVPLITLNGAAATGTIGFQARSTTVSIEDLLIH